MVTFNYYIENFINITSSDLQKKINNNEEFVLFVGKSTCPFCQKFLPKLNNVISEMNKKVYFLDSSNYNDENLEEFREKHKIVTVPALLVSKIKEIKVFCDSSKSEEYIKKFITE